jgi:hypothetical protein
MARWILYCPKCNFQIPHSEISEDGRVDHFLGTVLKPLFPPEGQSLECPNCKITSLFHRHELIYRT